MDKLLVGNGPETGSNTMKLVPVYETRLRNKARIVKQKISCSGKPFHADRTMDRLRSYDVVILSDIGANTLLLHPDVWLNGKPVANRLKLLRDWTTSGGGLVMVGGYFSFQGIDGKARWRRTAVEEALPVECLPYDDRLAN